jgi:hypothetical protein
MSAKSTLASERLSCKNFIDARCIKVKKIFQRLIQKDCERWRCSRDFSRALENQNGVFV